MAEYNPLQKCFTAVSHKPKKKCFTAVGTEENRKKKEITHMTWPSKDGDYWASRVAWRRPAVNPEARRGRCCWPWAPAAPAADRSSCPAWLPRPSATPVIQSQHHGSSDRSKHQAGDDQQFLWRNAIEVVTARGRRRTGMRRGGGSSVGKARRRSATFLAGDRGGAPLMVLPRVSWSGQQHEEEEQEEGEG